MKSFTTFTGTMHINHHHGKCASVGQNAHLLSLGHMLDTLELNQLVD